MQRPLGTYAAEAGDSTEHKQLQVHTWWQAAAVAKVALLLRCFASVAAKAVPRLAPNSFILLTCAWLSRVCVSGESSLAAEAVQLPFPLAAVQRTVTVACITEQ